MSSRSGGLVHEVPLTPGLAVSFQRYPSPPAGVVTELPTSRGALPLAVQAPEHVIVPCPAGEAFWVGFVPSPGRAPCHVCVVASTTAGELIDALTGAPVTSDRPDDGEAFHSPPSPGLPGISRGDGTWWALTLDIGGASGPRCRELRLHWRPAVASREPRHRTDERSLRVEVADVPRFETLAGTSVPASSERSTYGGWRLP